jgi:hypothetical protein
MTAATTDVSWVEGAGAVVPNAKGKRGPIVLPPIKTTNIEIMPIKRSNGSCVTKSFVSRFCMLFLT